jgi:hypothetical protein
MGLSDRTVETRLGHLFEKLGLRVAQKPSKSRRRGLVRLERSTFV